MQKLANISTFESLQNQANASFTRMSPLAVFNIADPKDYYTGKPSNLDVWVSEPVMGKQVEPGHDHYRYIIFKTTDGDFALQETWPDATGKISMTGYKNRIVASGSLESVSAKHKECTGQEPKFKKGFGPAEQ